MAPRNLLIEPWNTAQMTLIDKEIHLRVRQQGPPIPFRPIRPRPVGLGAVGGSAASSAANSCSSSPSDPRKRSIKDAGQLSSPSQSASLPTIPLFFHVLGAEEERKQAPFRAKPGSAKPWVLQQEAWSLSPSGAGPPLSRGSDASRRLLSSPSSQRSSFQL
eukprot:TRINITY_DN69697_c0_g1_i1.p1 TRINITY_DN69697_c0_g1~~TRINITY_DN69697_c0_g1_i1.p1  ORF type:complete len:184 (-),score=11.84 TRINITY_DN69697_c0_g1_i1:42-524(-)